MPEWVVPARSVLKRSYVQALALARVDRMMGAIHARRGAVLVLKLHRVSPQPNPYWPPLTPEAFSSLAEFLSSCCHCSTFAALPVRPPGSRPVVVMSFDDGCRDFIEYAMPILHRYRIRANHNVIGQCVETGRPPWTIMLSDALAAASRERIDQIRIAGFPGRLTASDHTSKARFGAALSTFLKARDPPRRRTVWPAIQALLDDTPPDSWTRMLSAADCRELADEHELGSHSYSHESMSYLDDGEFCADLDKCTSLFATIGRRVNVYAFPNDSYRVAQLSILRARGFEHLLVGPGPKIDVAGLYRRLTIFGDSVAELRLRAMAAPFPTGIAR